MVVEPDSRPLDTLCCESRRSTRKSSLQAENKRSERCSADADERAIVRGHGRPSPSIPGLKSRLRSCRRRFRQCPGREACVGLLPGKVAFGVKLTYDTIGQQQGKPHEPRIHNAIERRRHLSTAARALREKAPGGRFRRFAGILTGSSLQYTQEIRSVLQVRLRAAATLMSVGFAALVVRHLFEAGKAGLGIPIEAVVGTAVTVVLIALSLALSSRWRPSMHALRLVEVSSFGAVAVFFAWLQFNHLSWCVHNDVVERLVHSRRKHASPGCCSFFFTACLFPIPGPGRR